MCLQQLCLRPDLARAFVSDESHGVSASRLVGKRHEQSWTGGCQLCAHANHHSQHSMQFRCMLLYLSFYGLSIDYWIQQTILVSEFHSPHSLSDETVSFAFGMQPRNSTSLRWRSRPQKAGSSSCLPYSCWSYRSITSSGTTAVSLQQ